MSDQQPPRRRRIAGESKPGDQARPAARRVVRKPVARPGAAPAAKQQPAPKPKPEARKTPAAKPKPEARKTPAAKPKPEARKTPAARPEPTARANTSAAATESTRPARPAPVRREKPATTSGADGVTWSRPLVAIAVLAAAAVVFGVVGVVLGVDSWRGSRGIDGAQDAATEAAATSVGEIFSYDYTDVKGHLADAQKLMTPSFGKKFETISPALDELAPQRKIQVKAESREAAAVPCGDDCDKDAVTVLVFFDQARLADGSKTPTVFGNRVAVSMVKDGGDWLVDDIRAL